MMIAQLRGAIVLIDDAGIVIDVGGVGYAVTVSGKTRSGLLAGDAAVTLLTEMQVREDSMTLFGFVDAAEREAFRLLVTVQGVGAKAAMAILTVLGPDEIAAAVMSGDKAMVARVDGVGPKLAQRIVNELASKIGSLPVAGVPSGAAVPAGGEIGSVGADAMSALVNLGYGRAEAHAAMQRARAAGAEDELSALIAATLQELGQ
ncbi:MAG: Holliday junction branch migration protein RuvA [Pseudomonadota bacterium]|nr:Holliday junction branch migration protein RuvA [Pseudomonadota bacterium]